MRKIIYVTLAAVLLSSCTGIAPFSKQKYGHLKWIHKGGAVEEKTAKVEPGTSNNKQHLVVPANTEKVNSEIAINKIEPAPGTTGLPAEAKKAETKNQPVIIQNQGHAPLNVSQTANASQHKKIMRNVKKPFNPGMDGDLQLVLAIILSIFLPPLGVYIMRETGSPFWICLILCLLCWLFFLTPFFWGVGILWLIAIILALIAVLQDS